MEAVSWLRRELENKLAITASVPGYDTKHTNAMSKNSTFVKAATTNQGQTHLFQDGHIQWALLRFPSITCLSAKGTTPNTQVNLVRHDIVLLLPG